MKQTSISKRFMWSVLFAAVLIIFLTRGMALTHNRQLHPDEHVFYLSANSLLNSILHPGMEFIEHKEYPEGAYVFHAAFQLAGRVVSKLMGIEQDLQVWGRIGAVSCFAVGVLLGIRIVGKYIGKTKASVVLYALTMCFSLFFVEQSRYGVGDSISFMMLMLLITLTIQASEPEAKRGWWGAAFLASGVLGAIKYPQLIFVLIPLSAYFHSAPSEGKRKIRSAAGCLGICLIGFLLFSPKGMVDPGFFLRVLQSEGEAYITVGTAHEAGGVLNHLAAMLMYSTFYSDFPLLLPFVIWDMVTAWRKKTVQGGESRVDFLLNKVIPGICIFFFVYNLFVPLLFFRTYTPFYGMITLYTAAFAGRLFEEKGIKRIAVIVLSVFMVLRGGFLVYVLSNEDAVSSRVREQIQFAVDAGVQEDYVLSLWSLGPGVVSDQNLDISSLGGLIADNQGMEMKPGQLVITGSYGFHLGQDYIFPVHGDSQKSIDEWKEFQQANAQYLIGQAYPDWYYYLFGAWIRGGTLSKYDMPVNYIYYRN